MHQAQYPAFMEGVKHWDVLLQENNQQWGWVMRRSHCWHPLIDYFCYNMSPRGKKHICLQLHFSKMLYPFYSYVQCCGFYSYISMSMKQVSSCSRLCNSSYKHYFLARMSFLFCLQVNKKQFFILRRNQDA